MTDYAELIKELRSHKERWECAGGSGWETPEVCIQAATALEAQAAELAAVKEMYAREGAKALYELERAEAAEAHVKELEDLCNSLEAQAMGLAHDLKRAEDKLAEKDKEMEYLTLKYETLKLAYDLERQRPVRAGGNNGE